jgi:hypothetical protein
MDELTLEEDSMVLNEKLEETINEMITTEETTKSHQRNLQSSLTLGRK